MGQKLPTAPSTDKVREGVARLINPLAGRAGGTTPTSGSPATRPSGGPVMTRRADAPDIHLPASGRRRTNKRVSMASPANRRMRSR